MVDSALDGRSALVTGGGTGIGFGCAQRLLQRGAAVTIAGRRSDVLESAAEQLRTQVPGADIRFCTCDVTDEEQLAAAVATAREAPGRFDIAVANAGSGVPGPILALESSHWRFANDLNILGTALTIKHAGLAMREHGGSIVAMSSVNAVALARYMAPYCVSKAGLEMLVRCAALELAPFRIRVNCIEPGYIPTEGTAMAFTEEEEQSLVAATPLQRCGRAEEIGDAVVYFAAESGAWVTGQVLAVDGGLALPVIEDFERICRGIYGDDLMDQCTRPARD